MANPDRDTAYTTDNRTVYSRESSSTGWFVGIIVALALLAIGYLVFSANTGPTTTSTTVTTETPMTAPTTEAPATGVETTPMAPAETAPATKAPPATEAPPATDTAPATEAPAAGAEIEPAPAN